MKSKTLSPIIFLLLLFSVYFASAALIAPKVAAVVGKNFYYERVSEKHNVDYQSINLSLVHTEKIKGQAALYLFNVSNGGFIIVAAEDHSYPVPAYDFRHKLSMEQPAPAFIEWIQGYLAQIDEIRSQKLPAGPKLKALWQRYRQVHSGQQAAFHGKSVDPLLLSEWDQGNKYNELCPADQLGPGGHVYAGCVAVAMAQIMYYYKYPRQGNGSHSYYAQGYGTQTVNYGATNYEWEAMSNKIIGSSNLEVAKLLYHCGVAVDMHYTPSGSGAWSNRCVSAYKNYFRYQNGVSLLNKTDYSSGVWNDMLRTSLDNKIPLYYHGYPTTGSGSGHAFNLDGYQGSDHFHFNWGWSGAYNGYYYLSNLNPGNSDFSGGQGAIFNIIPDSTLYPYSCQSSKVISAQKGVVFDGSGPAPYQDSLDCYFLISPTEPVDHIELQFNRFDLAYGDIVSVYDGASTTDSLLGFFTGSSLPPALSSTGRHMLIRFKTNQSQVADGFDASFSGIEPVYCSGTTLLNGPTGTFSDGSDTNKYANGRICRWLIDGGGQPGVKLYFTSFKTEYQKDFVKIYDPTTTPATLLASYSGHYLPPAVYGNNGKLFVVFATSPEHNDEGWTAVYFTGQTGIQEQAAGQIKLFPNPAQAYIQVQMTAATATGMQIRIIDISGKTVLSRNAESKDLRVDVSTLSPGVYTTEVQGRDFIVRKIFLKE